MHVVAAVMMGTDGRVLLTQRPPGAYLAGWWEFPGGKLEQGESPLAGLARELQEELGIAAQTGVPLIRVPWRYGERELLLDAWHVDRWQGVPVSMEGQALQWCDPARIDPAMLTPADRPILQALRLPTEYWITSEGISPEWIASEWVTSVATDNDVVEACYQRLYRAIESEGAKLLQLRMPAWPVAALRHLAARLLPVARQHAAQLLLNADIEGAIMLGAGVGVQLKAAQLASLTRRPLPLDRLVGASCHDANELARAAQAGADFATLSPVAPTPTHPGMQPLGWPHFHALAEAAALPVYALGGLTRAQVNQARAAGAQGVAGIRGFWTD